MPIAVLILGTAFLLGILHAFSPDHLAAVSTFVSHRRRLSSALMVSVRWGVGHLMSVLLLGLLIAALAVPFPSQLKPYAEFAAGLVLVFVGGISLRRSFRARKLHFHRHSHGSLVHSHLHSHALGKEHFDNHAATFTGAVHGLAGAVPALPLVPIATMGSSWLAGAYLLVFGFGVILGMAFYCLALCGLLRNLSEVRLETWVQPMIAASSCVLGVAWMIGTGLLTA